MKKIYWISRHPPVESQVQALRERFKSEIEIIMAPNTFSSADAIIERYRQSGADDLVVVAPLSMIQRLCEKGVHPLWAEMRQVHDGEPYDVLTSGRKYRFIRFRRIKSVTINFED